MAHISKLLIGAGLTLLWRTRPRIQRWTSGTLFPSHDDTQSSTDERETLRALVQRFPYWTHGRVILADVSLLHNDVATAYAEAQALRMLAHKGSTHEATALFLLGRCFLQRGEASSAISLFKHAHDLRPNDHRIQEEQSAAYALLGDKTQALAILQTIPPAHLSPESKAAMQWLVSGQAQEGTTGK